MALIWLLRFQDWTVRDRDGVRVKVRVVDRVRHRVEVGSEGLAYVGNRPYFSIKIAMIKIKILVLDRVIGTVTWSESLSEGGGIDFALECATCK